jgi:hypothetical protein
MLREQLAEAKAMAVHLKMDFRILELSNTLHILQCQRSAVTCEHGVEYNPKQAGALMRAIHQLRMHTCSPIEPPVPSKGPRVASIRRVVVESAEERGA